jgi:MSHA pilin protein MshD
MLRKHALAVAEGLMQEIQLKNFANPGGGYTGTDRSQFDDVRDYHGYATTGVMSADNTAVLGLEKYNVAVTVTDAAFGSATLTVGAGNAVLITVTVDYPGGSIALSGYRTGYASDA